LNRLGGNWKKKQTKHNRAAEYDEHQGRELTLVQRTEQK
jgi:hypothetical protein